AMPPQGRHETREIGQKSKIERDVSPLNGQLGAAQAVDQTFLNLTESHTIVWHIAGILLGGLWHPANAAKADS
ncbi:MAG: hypothetical protein ACKVPY_14380, partial [Paracoccaceae bacterium]